MKTNSYALADIY